MGELGYSGRQDAYDKTRRQHHRPPDCLRVDLQCGRKLHIALSFVRFVRLPHQSLVRVSDELARALIFSRAVVLTMKSSTFAAMRLATSGSICVVCPSPCCCSFSGSLAVWSFSLVIPWSALGSDDTTSAQPLRSSEDETILMATSETDGRWLLITRDPGISS